MRTTSQPSQIEPDGGKDPLDPDKGQETDDKDGKSLQVGNG